MVPRDHHSPLLLVQSNTSSSLCLQPERVFSDRLSSAPQGAEEESVPPLRVFSERSLLLHFNNQLKRAAASQTQKSCHTTLIV